MGTKSPQNEDNYSIPEVNEKFKIESIDTPKKGYLYTVCDGMGGANAGEVASELASHWLLKYYYESTNIEDLQLWFESQIKKINKDLYKLSKEHEEYAGMGSTLVSLLILGKEAYIANVGDSRLYLFDLDNSRFEQITEDHSEVWELYKNGHIEKDDIINNRRKHILTQAMGTEGDVKVNTYNIKLPKQYMFLLCTDGLTDVATDEMLLHTISQSSDIDDCAKDLYDLSQKHDSKDDVTILLVTNITERKFVGTIRNCYKKISQLQTNEYRQEQALNKEQNLKDKFGVKNQKKNFIILGVAIIIIIVFCLVFMPTKEKETDENGNKLIDSTAIDTSNIEKPTYVDHSSQLLDTTFQDSNMFDSTIDKIILDKINEDSLDVSTSKEES